MFLSPCWRRVADGYVLPLSLCLRRYAAAVLLLYALQPAMAQQGGSGATDPGQVERRITPPVAPSQPIGDISVPEPSAVTPAPGAAVDTFILAGVEISGSSAYTPGALSFAYEEFLSREISRDEINEILGRITTKYRDDGYMLSRAVAGLQIIEYGLLRVRVIEGYIEQVKFSGANPGGQRLLQDFSDKITANQPLKLAALERYLLLMSDASGLAVTPSITALDEQRGTYLLNIELRHRPVDGFFNLDNRGTTAVGPLQALAGVNFNSLLGQLERTRLSVLTIPATPEELRYIEIFHEEILSAEGARASLAFSRVIVDAGEAGTDSKENNRGTRIVAGLSYPFVRSRQTNVGGQMNFDALNSDKNAATQVFDDRLRVLRLAGWLDHVDDLGGTSWLTIEASKGLDILGATDEKSTRVSVEGGRSEFYKFKLDAARLQELAENWSLYFDMSAQASPQTLLSSEEFSAGGKRFGRAYNPAAISSSDGAAAAAELRFDSPLKPEWIRRIQPYGFYDIATVWGVSLAKDSIASAGGGIRMGLPYNLDADLVFAVPLTRQITPGEDGDRDPRIFFNVLGRF